jgi:hypothetical protein
MRCEVPSNASELESLAHEHKYLAFKNPYTDIICVLDLNDSFFNHPFITFSVYDFFNPGRKSNFVVQNATRFKDATQDYEVMHSLLLKLITVP